MIGVLIIGYNGECNSPSVENFMKKQQIMYIFHVRSNFRNLPSHLGSAKMTSIMDTLATRARDATSGTGGHLGFKTATCLFTVAAPIQLLFTLLERIIHFMHFSNNFGRYLQFLHFEFSSQVMDKWCRVPLH